MGYSRKSLYKLFVFYCVIFLILILWLLADSIIGRQKSQIENNLSVSLGQKISIHGLKFFPPNFISVKGIFVDIKESPVTIEKARLSFSLRKFVFKRKFSVTRVYLENPKINFLNKINFSDCLVFLKEGIKQSIQVLAMLNREQNIKISIKNSIIGFPMDDEHLSGITVTTLEAQGDTVISLGHIDLKSAGSLNRLNSIKYNFRISSKGNDLKVENLELRQADFYIKLWGIIGEDILKFNGFSFFGRASREPAQQGNLPGPKVIWLSSLEDLSILDIDCAVKFSNRGIVIENLSLLLNNIPVSLNGSVFYENRLSLDLKVSYLPNKSAEYRLKNYGFDLGIKGILEEKNFNGKVNLSFFKKTGDKILEDKIETGFKNLSLDFVKDNRARVSLEEADFSYATGMDLYHVDLKNFGGVFNLEGRKIKFGFISSIYDGVVRGKGLLDASGKPLKSYFDLKIKDSDAFKFNSLVVYLLRFSGKLDSEIYMRTYPDFNLKGTLTIREGTVEDLRFFNWLSDFFNLPSLKKVRFGRFFTEFLLNKDVSGLNLIDLEGKDLRLNGDFSLYKTDMVSGKLFLSLSQGLLKNSEKFKPLLEIIGRDAEFISFDFQLSGLFEAMNFKWLESDFKKRLQDSLPNFVERGIEKKIESAIGAILTE